MTCSLPTRQAGDADQSSRPDGYERNQACSLATPKLPESLSDRYSFWEFSYPPTNCIAKPGGASRTSSRPTTEDPTPPRFPLPAAPVLWTNKPRELALRLPRFQS